MATQKLLSVLFAAFFIVASLSLISAATTFSQGINMVSVTTINAPTGATPATVDGVSAVTFVLGSNYLNVTATIDYSKFQVGRDYSIPFTITNATATQNVSVPIFKNFCTNGENASDIEITEVDSNIDFDSWAPLDDIVLTINVNNKNDSKQKIEVEVSLYDVTDNKLVKIDGTNKKFTQSYSIDDDNDHDYKINFKIAPTLEARSDYRLLVKAYKSSSETTKCTSKDVTTSTFYTPVTIDYGDEEMLIANIVGPTSIACGQTDTLSFDLYNLNYGEDEKFRVNLASVDKKLGINLASDIVELSDGQSQHFDFPLTIPTNASAVQYDVKIVVDYDYQDSTEKFSNSKIYSYILKVDSCKNEVKNATITAEFSADTPKAVIGGQTVIEATITNTGNVETQYTLGVSDVSAWAKSTIDPSTVTIAAGQSAKVKIYFDIDSKAVESNKEFTITATAPGLAVNQKVSIPLEKGLTTQALLNHFKNNWYIYAIVLVNLILIIAIIIAVKSIVRKN